MWKELQLRIGSLSFVVAHETGHTVGAKDEYAKSECNALDLCGWSNTVNGNCEIPFGNDPCIMDSGTFKPCNFTRKHFGWNDEDNDGVVDPYDEDYIIPGIPNP
jgi:hypothetical protein